MIQLPQTCSIGSAHGKLILLGEHSVVYGMPAIAIPFTSLKVWATVEAIPDPLTFNCDFFQGPLVNVPVKLRGLAACITETLTRLNEPQSGLLITIHSSIPIGRGLGSSAAIALAIVKSLFAFFNKKLHHHTLMSLVHIAETYAHGNPSGIDMYTASSAKPLWFQKGRPIEALHIARPLYLVVADTGRFGDTHLAVSNVRKAFENHPKKTKESLAQLEMLTHEARLALARGERKRLGRLLDLAQAELIAIGVSDAGINHLIDVARNAGALGAKLTGGGLGGCVLALAKSLPHAKAMANRLMTAGACNSWYFKLEAGNEGETINEGNCTSLYKYCAH
ncbi:mevalonate kinase [Bacillus sp. DNRA2]|uniref:mevalonate kinase n=1 Tax=Bacillus sp. DNRA2 TaxID=2723053 RepID=UPI00145DB806|nr:mevalonate kinase [Bacillus sp. DNRA2]NMD68679.1 mevalonate kinase [Bacillus sp. DNRA2]